MPVTRAAASLLLLVVLAHPTCGLRAVPGLLPARTRPPLCGGAANDCVAAPGAPRRRALDLGSITAIADAGERLTAEAIKPQTARSAGGAATSSSSRMASSRCTMPSAAASRTLAASPSSASCRRQGDHAAAELAAAVVVCGMEVVKPQQDIAQVVWRQQGPPQRRDWSPLEKYNVNRSGTCGSRKSPSSWACTTRSRRSQAKSSPRASCGSFALRPHR